MKSDSDSKITFNIKTDKPLDNHTGRIEQVSLAASSIISLSSENQGNYNQSPTPIHPYTPYSCEIELAHSLDGILKPKRQGSDSLIDRRSNSPNSPNSPEFQSQSQSLSQLRPQIDVSTKEAQFPTGYSLLRTPENPPPITPSTTSRKKQNSKHSRGVEETGSERIATISTSEPPVSYSILIAQL